MAISDRNHVILSVKACTEASISLAPMSRPTLDPSVEFILVENGQSTLKVNGEVKVSDQFSNVATCDVSRVFWISWLNNVFQIGRGPDLNLEGLLKYEASDFNKSLEVLSMATATAEGIWRFPRITGRPFKFQSELTLYTSYLI